MFMSPNIDHPSRTSARSPRRLSMRMGINYECTRRRVSTGSSSTGSIGTFLLVAGLISCRRNSILADEMGLGKTAQTTIFIYTLLRTYHMTPPFLVVYELFLSVDGSRWLHCQPSPIGREKSDNGRTSMLWSCMETVLLVLY